MYQRDRGDVPGTRDSECQKSRADLHLTSDSATWA
jgi:hypothetical protein